MVSKKGTENIVRQEGHSGSALSEDEARQLEALKAFDVDFSDIPDMATRDGWVAAIPTARNKQAVSIRLDPEVLEYFRSSGRRYQTLINNVLRAYVDAQRGKLGRR